MSPAEFAASKGTPQLIVTVGSGALGAVAVSKPARTGIPVLATLVPRITYERELQRGGGVLQASAVFLDQPPARQAALIRAALPAARTVGVLFGAESRGQAPALRAALSAQNLTMHGEDASSRGQFFALQSVLDDSDVLLAVADPGVFNSETIANILTAGYRRSVPMLAFSPSYVRAGALFGLYSTPEQAAATSAEVIRTVLSGKPLPKPTAVSEFVVDVNAAVARSLGLTLDSGRLQAILREREQRP
jgi:ABC-type uncharacterized transport system substrate-binding protein